MERIQNSLDFKLLDIEEEIKSNNDIDHYIRYIKRLFEEDKNYECHESTKIIRNLNYKY